MAVQRTRGGVFVVVVVSSCGDADNAPRPSTGLPHELGWRCGRIAVQLLIIAGHDRRVCNVAQWICSGLWRTFATMQCT